MAVVAKSEVGPKAGIWELSRVERQSTTKRHLQKYTCSFLDWAHALFLRLIRPPFFHQLHIHSSMTVSRLYLDCLSQTKNEFIITKPNTHVTHGCLRYIEYS